VGTYAFVRENGCREKGYWTQVGVLLKGQNYTIFPDDISVLQDLQDTLRNG
jgi:hypothetical protein